MHRAQALLALHVHWRPPKRDGISLLLMTISLWATRGPPDARYCSSVSVAPSTAPPPAPPAWPQSSSGQDSAPYLLRVTKKKTPPAPAPARRASACAGSSFHTQPEPYLSSSSLLPLHHLVPGPITHYPARLPCPALPLTELFRWDRTARNNALSARTPHLVLSSAPIPFSLTSPSYIRHPALSRPSPRLVNPRSDLQISGRLFSPSLRGAYTFPIPAP